MLLAGVGATALMVLTPSNAHADVTARTGGARLALSTSLVHIGERYVAVATQFAPGEAVRFSWTGPTTGTMGTSRAGSDGRGVHGPILEKDPPGNYTITATGLTSHHVASTALRVAPHTAGPSTGHNAPTP